MQEQTKVFGFWVTGDTGASVLSARHDIAVAIAGAGMQIASEQLTYSKEGPLAGNWLRVVVKEDGGEEALSGILSGRNVTQFGPSPDAQTIPALR